MSNTIRVTFKGVAIATILVLAITLLPIQMTEATHAGSSGSTSGSSSSSSSSGSGRNTRISSNVRTTGSTRLSTGGRTRDSSGRETVDTRRSVTYNSGTRDQFTVQNIYTQGSNIYGRLNGVTYVYRGNRLISAGGRVGVGNVWEAVSSRSGSDRGSSGSGRTSFSPPNTPRVTTSRPTCTLTASPSTIASGDRARLQWTSRNATSASINQGIGSVSTSGSRQVSPVRTTTYTLTVRGSGGSANCSGQVRVNQPPVIQAIEARDWASLMALLRDDAERGIFNAQLRALIDAELERNRNNLPQAEISITALPALVRSGGTTVVRWESNFTRSCTVTGTSGDSWNGVLGEETSSAITRVETYTLRCLNLAGDPVEQAVEVRILPTFQEV